MYPVSVDLCLFAYLAVFIFGLGSFFHGVKFHWYTGLSESLLLAFAVRWIDALSGEATLIFIFAAILIMGQCLTLWHSEQPKLQSIGCSECIRVKEKNFLIWKQILSFKSRLLRKGMFIHGNTQMVTIVASCWKYYGEKAVYLYTFRYLFLYAHVREQEKCVTRMRKTRHKCLLFYQYQQSWPIDLYLILYIGCWEVYW